MEAEPDCFRYVVCKLGFEPVIDLFASRINKQLQRFMAYRPDPEAETIDAFSTPWSDLDFYAFPPFICVAKCLQKISMEGGTGIIVVPDWPSQSWFNTYLEMITHEVILPPRCDLLLLPNQMDTHPMNKTLRLRAGLVTTIAL